MPARYFTVQEANALLDKVRPLVSEIMDARSQIVAAQPELWPVLEKSIGNGGSRKAGALIGQFEIIQRNVQQIEALGATVKDINSGLVDFLSHRDGREIYLCWRYDEPHLGYWHDLDAGFAGRQPL